jgi:hypothetical protein
MRTARSLAFTFAFCVIAAGVIATAQSRSQCQQFSGSQDLTLTGGLTRHLTEACLGFSGRIPSTVLIVIQGYGPNDTSEPFSITAELGRTFLAATAPPPPGGESTVPAGRGTVQVVVNGAAWDSDRGTITFTPEGGRLSVHVVPLQPGPQDLTLVGTWKREGFPNAGGAGKPTFSRRSQSVQHDASGAAHTITYARTDLTFLDDPSDQGSGSAGRDVPAVSPSGGTGAALRRALLGALSVLVLLGGGLFVWTRRRRTTRVHIRHPHGYGRDGTDEPPANKQPVPVSPSKPDQPPRQGHAKKDEKKKVSRRFALLVGVGFRRAKFEPKESDEETSKVDDDRVKEFGLMMHSLEDIAGGLEHWGFSASETQNHMLLNAVATKQTILNELQGLVDRVNGMPLNTTSCFVKIHLMGHTRVDRPPQSQKRGAVNPPDAGDHYGVNTWDGRFEKTDAINPTAGSLLYDYEIAHYVKKISDLLTDRVSKHGLIANDSGILVQADQCYGESLLAPVVKIPFVYAGWAAGKHMEVQTPDQAVKGVRTSMYAQGFAQAFEANPDATTIDQAHKSAADRSNKESPEPERQGAGYTPTPSPINPSSSKAE